jgi:hypothetical protein
MNFMRKITLLSAIVLLIAATAWSGNPDRRGQAGATELLINPWARSSGLHSLNTASVRGIESVRMNVGGLAFTPKTELVFSNTQWLRGTGIQFNTLGFSQSTGESGVMGVDIMAVSFGEWDRTTVNNPEGGIGTIRPQFINIGLSYARSFSNSIHGGATVRVVNQSVANISASGVALDAGIQYVTGPEDNIKFGISLRNVGTPMRYSGDGLSFRGSSPSGDYTMTLNHRSESFEMPSLLHIGGAYDIDVAQNHRVTAVGNFTSNSFMNDQMGLGVEYAFQEMFMGRVGYKIEKGVLESEGQRHLAYTGFSAGVTAEIPLKSSDQGEEEEEEGEDVVGGDEEDTDEMKEKEHIPTISLDLSYRDTHRFGGTYSIGARINL